MSFTQALCVLGGVFSDRNAEIEVGKVAMLPYFEDMG